MENIPTENLMIIAVVLGLTQAIKQAGVSKRYIPLIAIILGTGLGLLVGGLNVSAGFTGLISGLAAMGSWSGTKTVYKG